MGRWVGGWYLLGPGWDMFATYLGRVSTSLRPDLGCVVVYLGTILDMLGLVWDMRGTCWDMFGVWSDT